MSLLLTCDDGKLVFQGLKGSILDQNRRLKIPYLEAYSREISSCGPKEQQHFFQVCTLVYQRAYFNIFCIGV